MIDSSFPHILSSSAVKLMKGKRTGDNTCQKRYNDSQQSFKNFEYSLQTCSVLHCLHMTVFKDTKNFQDSTNYLHFYCSQYWVLQSNEALHTDLLHCQVYHVISQILQTNTCLYLKLGHDHFVLQPYDSYHTSQSHHFLLYHPSNWQCC